jgi:hypothetical protein
MLNTLSFCCRLLAVSRKKRTIGWDPVEKNKMVLKMVFRKISFLKTMEWDNPAQV